jgi:chromate transporter
MKDKNHILIKLFTTTFYLSSFTFGGGFVIITLMKKKFVDQLHWIDEKEMLDLTALAQSSPGAIAVNASILVGYRIAGFMGALVSILGTIMPPLIILSVVSLFYTTFRDNEIVNVVLKGMQAGVAAIIIDVVLNMGNNLLKQKSLLSILIMISAFIATYFFNINIAYIIFTCISIGLIKAYFQLKGTNNNDLS